MSATNMKAYSKLEHLFYRVYPALRNFPRHTHNSLCVKITESFTECLFCMNLANSVKTKRLSYLSTAEGHLHNLVLMMRFSKIQKFVSVGFYEQIDLLLTEIFKLLKGWIKSSIKT